MITHTINITTWEITRFPIETIEFNSISGMNNHVKIAVASMTSPIPHKMDVKPVNTVR